MTPGYVTAVADGLVFALGRVWERLAAQDRAIGAGAISAELATLRELGVRIDFGDGEVPEIPDAGARAIAVLRDQLRRIAEAAPVVLASGADTFARAASSCSTIRSSSRRDPKHSFTHGSTTTVLRERIAAWVPGAGCRRATAREPRAGRLSAAGIRAPRTRA